MSNNRSPLPPAAANSAPDASPDDLRNRVVFLGTGTSVGVPALGCDCEICTGGHPRDQRTRCAIVLGLPEGNLLIDTPPDLRTQLLRERIGLIHAVAFTHAHADHLFGLDDLRLFPFRLGHPVPLYCEPEVEARIRHSYDYCFATSPTTHPGARPQLEPRTIDAESPFLTLGAEIVPLRLMHGAAPVLGFRIGDFAYCTDTNGVPEATLEQLRGVRTFVIDALRFRPHPTHFSVDEAIELAACVGAEQTWLTHMSHDIGYETLQSQLPPGVGLAYDGLRLDFDWRSVEEPVQEPSAGSPATNPRQGRSR